MKKLIIILALMLTSSIIAFSQINVPNTNITTTINDSISNSDSIRKAQNKELVEQITNAIETKIINSSNRQSPFSGIGEDVIVPIVAIIGVFGMPTCIILILILFKYKNKKAKYDLAQRALETGKDIPEELFKYGENNSKLMIKGIQNTSIGIGLGVFLWAITGNAGIGCIGFMIMCIGIGQIVIHKTLHPSEKKNPFINIHKDEQSGKSHIKVGNIEINKQESAPKSPTEE